MGTAAWRWMRNEEVDGLREAVLPSLSVVSTFIRLEDYTKQVQDLLGSSARAYNVEELFRGGG
ncbi:hypothetical protein AKJ16_DCAP05341 [Drosera capensis]